MAININNAIEWLKKRQIESERNRQLFEGRPTVAASEAWGGYQDSPGGQRLMVRQREMPKVDNTLTIKDDGTRTHVKKWTDPDERTARFQSDARATALPPEPVMSPGRLLPPPRNQRNPFDIPQYGFPRGGLSPEAQAAIAQVQATGGQNVDASGNPIGVDVSNQRAMYHALRRPNPQVAHIPSMRGNIGSTQSIGVPNQDPRMRGMRPSIMNTGNWSDNLGNWYMNWRQKMIEADKRRRQRGNY